MNRCTPVEASQRQTTCSDEIRAPFEALHSRRFSVLKFASSGATVSPEDDEDDQERWSRLPPGLKTLAVNVQVQSDVLQLGWACLTVMLNCPTQSYSGKRPTVVKERDPIVCISNWIPYSLTALCGGGLHGGALATPAPRRRGSR